MFWKIVMFGEIILLGRFSLIVVGLKSFAPFLRLPHEYCTKIKQILNNVKNYEIFALNVLTFTSRCLSMALEHPLLSSASLWMNGYLNTYSHDSSVSQCISHPILGWWSYLQKSQWQYQTPSDYAKTLDIDHWCTYYTYLIFVIFFSTYTVFG